ncbi:lipopolysaccharide export system permease protein [Mariprofundus micogutta]|uniref:Lipopolysaccharide export system permease protein n=2 Tax=Mariprofundus micogutta TaxID=1921010 RepID=A0A1L8CP50_9PROT|nr:lipopolysaccharide export system permease protein [Mariprofundus micogutta]
MSALLAIYVIIESFDKARYLGHGLTTQLLIEYLLLKAPFLISEFMPIIVLIGASVYLVELSRHHEMVAIRAAGLGINKLLTPLLTVALLAAMFSFIIGEWVTPVTNQRLDTIEQVHIQKKEDGKHGVQWLKDGQRFFRLTPLANHQFALMMLETNTQGAWLKRVDAARATYAKRQWHLMDAHVSSPSLEQGMLLEHLDEMNISSAIGPETAEPPKPRHMQVAELNRYINNLNHAGLSSSSYTYALHRKFSAPLACLLMVILAAALCLNTGSRSGKASWGIVAAISLGLTFYVVGNAGHLLANSDRMPAAYAAWLPSIAFGGLALFLLLRREGH